MYTKCTAPPVECLSASLASIAITLTTVVIELAASILEPSAAFGGCTAKPIIAPISADVFAFPHALAVPIAEVVLLIGSMAMSSLEGHAALTTGISRGTAPPVRAILADLMLPSPSCIAVVVTEMALVLGRIARGSL